MKFKENLKQILNNRKLKQAELCRMTGIQTSLMSEYLSGKKSPTIGNALLIADALNISLDTLVGKDEYSYTENVSKSTNQIFVNSTSLDFLANNKISNDLDIDIETKEIIKSYALLNSKDKELVKNLINTLVEKK